MLPFTQCRIEIPLRIFSVVGASEVNVGSWRLCREVGRGEVWLVDVEQRLEVVRIFLEKSFLQAEGEVAQ